MKVTIGLPVFNVEEYIEDAMLSIIAQTYDDWECIVIDDGSTDKTLDIVKGYADSRFTVISDGANKGLVYRLNQISRLARGEYVARMDGDDIMHPERIASQVKILDKFQQIDVVSTLRYSIDTDNYVHKCERADEKNVTNVFYEILKSGYITHPTIMTRAYWSRQHPYSEAYVRAEDRELFARTINDKNSFVIPRPLYYYREIGNMSLEKYVKGYKTELKVLLKYGFKRVGGCRTAFLLVRWLIKYTLVHVMFFLGLENQLRKAKNGNLYKNLDNTVYLRGFLRATKERLLSHQAS